MISNRIMEPATARSAPAEDATMRDLLVRSTLYEDMKTDTIYSWKAFLADQMPKYRDIILDLCSPIAKTVLNAAAAYSHTWSLQRLLDWYEVLTFIGAPSSLRNRVASLLTFNVMAPVPTATAATSEQRKVGKKWKSRPSDTFGVTVCWLGCHEGVEAIIRQVKNTLASDRFPTALLSLSEMNWQPQNTHIACATKLLVALACDDEDGALHVLTALPGGCLWKVNGIAEIIRTFNATHCAIAIHNHFDPSVIVGDPSRFICSCFMGWPALSLSSFLQLFEAFHDSIPSSTIDSVNFLSTYGEASITALEQVCHISCTKPAEGAGGKVMHEGTAFAPIKYRVEELVLALNKMAHKFWKPILEWMVVHGRLSITADLHFMCAPLLRHCAKQLTSQPTSITAADSGASATALDTCSNLHIIETLNWLRLQLESDGKWDSAIAYAVIQAAEFTVDTIPKLVEFDPDVITNPFVVEEMWGYHFLHVAPRLKLVEVVLPIVEKHHALELHLPNLVRFAEDNINSGLFEVADAVLPYLTKSTESNPLHATTLAMKALQDNRPLALQWLSKNVAADYAALPIVCAESALQLVEQAGVESLQWMHDHVCPADKWCSQSTLSRTKFVRKLGTALCRAIESYSNRTEDALRVLCWLDEKLLPASAWPASPAISAAGRNAVSVLQWCATHRTVDLRHFPRKVLMSCATDEGISVVEPFLSEEDKAAVVFEMLHDPIRSGVAVSLIKWATRLQSSLKLS